MDLVSYNEKHNWNNGENNNDGGNDNHSWNCGWEGETDNPDINALRFRQIRNVAAILMTSQGIPMILMGDEVGHSQLGNNNMYCHDTETNWFDWRLTEKNADLLRFFQHIIAFRRAHPVLRNRYHLSQSDYVGSGYPDISWHGTQAWMADWSASSTALAFMLCGKHARGGQVQDDYIYVAMNTYSDALWFNIPQLPAGMQWHLSVNTSMPSPQDIWALGDEPVLEEQQNILLGNHSVVILVGR
jgi:glycogen operon protein